MNKRFNFGYTLTEVVIVMLVIAVVVSVSIKVTKTKLDSITGYTYYTAYSNVRSVATAMVKDFDPDNEDYSVVYSDGSLFSKMKSFFASNFSILPAFSAFNDPCSGNCPSGYRCVNGQCIADNDIGDQTIDDGNSPALPDRPSADPDPPGPGPGPGPGPDPDPVCPDEIPCGSECNASTGFTVKNIAGFSRNCADATEAWSESACRCVVTPNTVPRDGANFCKLFVSYANTSHNAIAEDDECKGDRVVDAANGFNNLKPDFVLRNGMRFYNVHQPYFNPPIFANNSQEKTFVDADGNSVDIDENVYLIYVDVDGSRAGNGVLWEDVFPFYITLSGTVIPAFYNGSDSSIDTGAGGDNIRYLKTSVADQHTNVVDWLTVSKSFRESACTMGLVKDTTTYCSGYTYNNRCSEEGHDCSLKLVMPVKFFGN